MSKPTGFSVFYLVQLMQAGDSRALQKGEIKIMDSESLLKDKIVLTVDDEVDVTATV